MNKLLLIVVFVTVLFSGFAQDWMTSGGGIGNDAALDVQVDQNGNIFTTGYIEGVTNFGNGQVTAISNGFTDIYLSKCDASGNFLWVKSFGGTNADRGYDLAIDNSGDVYVTGYFIGNADFDGTSISAVGGSQDIFIAKFNNNGTLIWVVSEGGNDGETGFAIDVDSQGDVLVTGQFSGVSNIAGSSLTSVLDPNTGQPSFDMFVAKYDQNGNPLWAKQGEAEFDDRGICVAVDDDDNIYIGGQFSDTLVLDGVVHNNNVMNAGFLLKLDPLGNESWFRVLAASQTLVRDMKVNDDNVVITGDFQGQMIVLGGSSPHALNGNYTYRYFLIEINENGNVNWDAVSSSDSELSSKALCIDSNDDIYITGTFKCVLDDYADQLGNGFFNSVGHSDVFVTKYSQNGSKDYSYQYGGQYDDFGQGITISQADKPILAGGFDKLFNFNVGNGYNSAIGNSSIINSPQMTNINTTAVLPEINNCTQLGTYYNITSYGNSDVFIGRIIDVSLQTYYYYLNTQCGEVSDYCIEYMDDNEICSDSIVICNNGGGLFGVTNTEGFGLGGWNNVPSVGPYYDFLWATGNQNPGNYASFNGNYSVQSTSIDGCFYGDDTVNVTVGAAVFVDSLYFDTIVPVLGMIDVVDQNDSIVICEGENVWFVVMDSLTNPMLDPFTEYCGDFYGNVTWNGVDGPAACLLNIVSPTVTGWFNVEVNFILFNEAPNCLIDTMHYNLVDSFYVEVIQVGVHNINIIGDTLFCPSDTVVLAVDSILPGYSWVGNVISQSSAGDSIWVNTDGIYAYQGSGFVDPQTGCPMNTSGGVFVLESKVSSNIWSNIADNVICPGDSLLLTSAPAINYQWVSPQGLLIGNGQSIWVDVPGFYYCLQTDSTGCTLSSNTIELIEYNTPFLLAEPGTDLCFSSSIEVAVLHTGSPVFQWTGPISSTSDTILITQPGTYYVEVTQCGVTVEDSVVITPTTAISEITFVSDTAVCPGDTVVLQANNGMDDYQWHPIGIGQQIQVLDSGYYSVTTTSSDGCVALSQEVYIAFSPSPISPEVNVPDGVCENDTITIVDLSYNSQYSVDWYFSQQVISTTPQLIINGFDLTNEGYYTIVHEYLGCSRDTSFFLAYYTPSDALVLEINNPLCLGDDLLLNASAEPGVSFEWEGPGYSSSGESDTIFDVQYSNEGEYFVTHTNLEGCSAFESFVVVINEYPFLDLGEDTTVCNGMEVLFDAGLDYDNYLWNTGGINSTEYCFDEGWYWLDVANKNCWYRDSIYLQLKDCTVHPANVFSPNNDGVNDVWKISGEELHNPNIEIYDRWGSKVGQITNENQSWNGNHYMSDKELSDGVYFFVGTVVDGYDNIVEISGFIHLLRH